jgi:SNF2 family DNA or RNA helicase
MNQPIDLYTTLNWLGYENHSAYAFKNHYCIMGGFGKHQIVGYKNLPELQSILDKCMLRRLKSDVLDLPEKIYINDYVEMTKAQIKLYDEVRNNLIENIDKIKLSPNPLVQLIRLRQVTGNPNILSSSINDNPKFNRMCEIIEDAIENGGKVLVFSNWTDVIEPAYELVKSMKYKKDGRDKRYNPAMYTGQNKDVREQEKDRFMTDPDCKVLLGTMGAMGTGLTLTAANTVIFLDEPWNRAIKDQCEDRVHRIGTKDSPNIITIMCKGTIDEKINDLVDKKGKMSDVLIDKEEDLMRNPKVVNYLLSLE